MAAWYIDSVSYAAVTAWSAGASISAGALRRPTAPSVGNERVVVCIVAGTTHASTEPTWTTTKGAKNTDNTVTWQECTGQPGVCGSLTDQDNWTAVKNTSVSLGKVIQNDAGTFLFICSTAGTAGNGSEPTWNTTAGQTTADNTVTWTSLGAVGGFTAFLAAHARLGNAFATNWGAAGDTFYVGDDHAETQAAINTLTSPSTAASQCKIFCVDHTKVPAYATGDLKTTATITTTGANNLIIKTGGYYNGIIFQGGSGANITQVTPQPNAVPQVFENCQLAKLATVGATNAISIGAGVPTTGQSVTLKNTTVKFGSTSDAIYPNCSVLRWENTASAIAGATIPTTLFNKNTAAAGVVDLHGVDLSGLGSGTLFGNAASSSVYAQLVDCKFGSSYVIGTPSPGTIIDVIRGDSGGTNYIHSRTGYEGSHVVSTTVIRTGGSSDGTQAISWNVTTTANCTWFFPFICMPISKWNATTAANVTVTVNGVWNSASLPNNDDIWFDVEYLGSGSSPQATFATVTKASAFASNAALTADSTSAWDSAATARANSHSYSLGDIIKVASNSGRIFFCTTAGTSAGSEPGGYASAVDGGNVTDNTAVFRAARRFSMAVTLSSPQPAQAGPMIVLVKAVKASTTFYVDPLVVFS